MKTSIREAIHRGKHDQQSPACGAGKQQEGGESFPRSLVTGVGLAPFDLAHQSAPPMGLAFAGCFARALIREAR